MEATPADGNCMFASLASQLNLHGYATTSNEVRQQIVNFIRDLSTNSTKSTDVSRLSILVLSLLYLHNACI